MITIRLADTSADRERVFRFRYDIYIGQMGREQKHADHNQRVVREPLDESCVLWLAEDRGHVVGTVRANFGSQCDFGYYAKLFQMDSVGDAFPEHVMLTTKMMVHPDYRSTPLAVRLSTAVYRMARSRHIRHNFIDCNSHLEPFFMRLGFVPYCGYVEHPEYGTVLPMRGDVNDLDHLRAQRSPFARTRFEDPPNSEALAMTNSSTVIGATNIISVLDNKIQDVMRRVQESDFWVSACSPGSDPRLPELLMREIYLEIISYQPHVIEAAIASIAQFPRSMPVRIVRALLRHQAEEFDHGEMAMRDYKSLGGDEDYARNEHVTSPASFAAASVWWMIAKLRDPFAYLGALYPFEGMTPIVCDMAKPVLKAKGYPSQALEFIRFHSEEDPKHTELIRKVIEEIVELYPQAGQSVVQGMDRFLHVYPIPVWSAAFRRAEAALRPESYGAHSRC